jgi:hypothetical protein
MLDESKAPRDDNNNNNNNNTTNESKKNEDETNNRVRKTSREAPQRKTSKTFVPPKHLLLYLVRLVQCSCFLYIRCIVQCMYEESG